MATYYARKAGNINATDVWATTPGGVAAAVTFASGDVLVSNSFAITINVDTNLGGAGEIRNDAFSGAAAGGSFTITGSITLTANLINLSSTLLSVSNPTATIVNIVATTISSASSLVSAHYCISSTQAGSLNVTASNIIGSTFGAAARQGAIYVGGTGTTTINCPTITGGNNASRNAIAADSPVIINGNVIGGSLGAGLFYNNTGISIVTTATGGSGAVGLINNSTGAIRLTRAVGNAYGPGNSAGLAAAVGAANAGLGIIEIEQLEYGTYGMSPTSGTGIRLKKLGTNVAVFNYCDTAGAKTLIDATANAAMPAASNVRSGTPYGGALVGSLAVPLPSQVAVGVATDNTTGTAYINAADVATAVWGAATRTITGGTVDTLTNAPTVPSVVQIRQEMDSNSSKLANLDTTISSRLAPSGTLATVTTLTNAPTVPSASAIASQVRTELSPELTKVLALNPTRLAECATTEILGNLLAQANS